jgi:hypothetical protein
MNALQPVERALKTILCRTADRRPCRFFATFKAFIQGAAHQAGVGGFGVADKARIMDLVAAQAEVSGGSDVVLVNTTLPAALCHLTPRLGRIIFIGKAALGGGLDFQGIGLRTVGGSDEIIMGGFCVFEPGGPFGDIIG